MEKKTIGTFISALRKANGLTQKQLAEKLNVSDKAVSRWERDEAMPDLTIIPVLAEIFGVTSDEILRGQRDTPDTSAEKAADKTDKQRKRFLSEKKTRFRIRSTISIGIAVLGLIAAMICNFGFLRAYLGFLIGSVFYVAATVCQVIFVILHLSGLDEDIITTEELAQYRNHTYGFSSAVFSAIIILFSASLPLVIIPWDTYLGLDAGPWALYGGLYSVICLILCWIIVTLLQLVLAKRGLITLPQHKVASQKLRLKFSGILAMTLTVLVLVQAIINSILPDLLIKGTVLHSWDDFQTLMEEEKTEDYDIAYPHSVGQSSVFQYAEIATAPIDSIIESIPNDSENVEYHEDGSISLYPEYPTEQIRDKDGKLLCEFTARNRSVRGWKYEYKNDEWIITVYTGQDYEKVNAIMDSYINPIYLLLYPLAVVSICLLYRKKSKLIN